MRCTLNPTRIQTPEDLIQSDVQGSRAAAFYRDQHTRGKCFYLTVNCNFDTNSCAAQFTSKWGQTVDVRFLHPRNHPRMIKSSELEIGLIPFRFALSSF